MYECKHNVETEQMHVSISFTMNKISVRESYEHLLNRAAINSLLKLSVQGSEQHVCNCENMHNAQGG